MAAKNGPGNPPAGSPGKGAPLTSAEKKAAQQATETRLPRGADPAGQARSAGGSSNAPGISSGSAASSSERGNSSKMSRPSADEIARRAYERYQQRGASHGSDQDDWYAAERDLLGDSTAGGQRH